jgi:hypothetical protein
MLNSTQGNAHLVNLQMFSPKGEDPPGPLP